MLLMFAFHDPLPMRPGVTRVSSAALAGITLYVMRKATARLLKGAGDTIELLTSPVVHERAARVTGSRPWPPPARSWVMAQTWTELLFAHWRVPPEKLRRVVPSPLELQTFDGRAWLGVTPFQVRNLRLRVTPPFPFLSSFPEINVRTYVTFGGKPGVFFFSLDAASASAVAAARAVYRLPYFQADMAIAHDGGDVHYRSERLTRDSGPKAAFRGRYHALGPASPPAAGTLEHWLTERYCLYTMDDRQRVLRAEIQHPPWRLHPADAAIALNTMGNELGLELSEAPLVHYAARQDVVFWTLERATE